MHQLFGTNMGTADLFKGPMKLYFPYPIFTIWFLSYVYYKHVFIIRNVISTLKNGSGLP